MNNADRDLLERAAMAAGYTILGYGELCGGLPCLYLREADFTGMWAPLDDDGDALRLAVKLQMTVEHYPLIGQVEARHAYADDLRVIELYGDDRAAATRLAIVKCAAASMADPIQSQGT